MQLYLEAVQVAERYADGQATRAELKGCRVAIPDEGDFCESFAESIQTAARWLCSKLESNMVAHTIVALESAVYHRVRESTNDDEMADLAGDGEQQSQNALLRDIFGNPFRPVTLDPAWLSANDGLVVKLARGIYEDRAFDRMPVLADALEDAGCCDEQVLGHCRGPGPHARGCFVVDLLLQKT